MARKPAARPHHRYRQGGRPKKDHAPSRAPRPAPNKSWAPGRKGQGGEGFSKGYGGSRGRGTGPSGPDRDE
jgi:hypothetical protein